MSDRGTPSSRRALVALGANLGDRERELGEARRLLALYGELIAVSEVVETAAWGELDSPPYLNQVVDLAARVSPWKLHSLAKEHESARGREARCTVNAPRIIDVDLLLFERTTIRSAAFCVPHPRLWRRTFLHAVVETLPTLDRWRDELEASGFWDFPGRQR